MLEGLELKGSYCAAVLHTTRSNETKRRSTTPSISRTFVRNKNMYGFFMAWSLLNVLGCVSHGFPAPR